VAAAFFAAVSMILARFVSDDDRARPHFVVPAIAMLFAILAVVNLPGSPFGCGD
jgi:hypothetical protein